jgi:hypothetical protein
MLCAGSARLQAIYVRGNFRSYRGPVSNTVSLLSQQLADLSVHAKNAEHAVAPAANEAHAKIETRKEQARAAAAKATEKVNQEIKSAGA